MSAELTRAARLGLSGHDQLQHFIASPAWEDGPLWTELGRQANCLVGWPDACLVIDDTALPKKGTLSVGVARQYCGALGKQANCQSMVSLTLAVGEVPLPVGLRLFLPEAWTSDTCFIPGFDGAFLSGEWKEALWARFSMAAPQRLRRSVERYNIVKRA